MLPLDSDMGHSSSSVRFIPSSFAAGCSPPWGSGSPSPHLQSGTGVAWGGPGGAGGGRSGGSSAPAPAPQRAADLTPGGEAGSRRSNSVAVLTSAKTQGIKGTLMGSKLSSTPWRIPGCLCLCQINIPVKAVMFNIPSHYLAGIPGLLEGSRPGLSHIFPFIPRPANRAAAALESIFEM